MEILAVILIGFIVGLVARFLKPGDDSMGVIMTTLLGIGGAFVGDLLGRAFGLYGPHEAAGFIASVIGAILLLVIAQTLFGRRRTV